MEETIDPSVFKMSVMLNGRPLNFSRDETLLLEKEFGCDRFLDIVEGNVNDIADQVKLSPEKVGAWFECRRVKYYSANRF